MGLDPVSPLYIEGAPCGQCGATAFADKTPEFIMAVVSGVSNCPAAIFTFENGAYLLQQQGFFPCRWSTVGGNIGLDLTLEGGVSRFAISEFGTEQFFLDIKPDPCVFSFQNLILDCTLGDRGFGGVVFCFWGPGIGP